MTSAIPDDDRKCSLDAEYFDGYYFINLLLNDTTRSRGLRINVETMIEMVTHARSSLFKEKREGDFTRDGRSSEWNFCNVSPERKSRVAIRTLGVVRNIQRTRTRAAPPSDREFYNLRSAVSIRG